MDAVSHQNHSPPILHSSSLVLLFSLAFCMLQLPTFIATAIVTLRSSHYYLIHPDIFANTFCILGSLLNFFVYAASSNRFRSASKQFLCSRRTSSQYRGANSHAKVDGRNVMTSGAAVDRIGANLVNYTSRYSEGNMVIAPSALPRLYHQQQQQQQHHKPSITSVEEYDEVIEDKGH